MKGAYVGIMLVALCAVAEAKPAPAAAPIVVLDPGHGGSNLGAVGGSGTRHEKRVTLAIARQVQAALAARGIDAVLTRDDDRTLTLRQRLARAEAERADAFVSIHCNASPSRSQRGFETYVLTPTGVDVDARALRTDVGVPRPAVDPQVGAMLDDVERGAAQWDAAELAVAMQRRLRGVRGSDGDRGVRQDAQHVLLGATMPAVLVEVGFIDHPAEGRELVDPAVQDQLAGAIAQAIASRLDR